MRQESTAADSTRSLGLLVAAALVAALTGCTDPEDGGSSTVDPVLDPEKAWPSYTLYSGRYTEEAHLLDMNGDVVHTWTYPQDLSWCYAELMEDGNLAVIVKEQEDEFDGLFFELDLDSNVLRTIELPAHHDFVRRPNGNTILLCREYVNNDAVFEHEAKSDYFVEVTPDDEVVWEWHADAHALKLQQFVDVEFPREMRDWAHTNTIEVLPATPAGEADERFREGNYVFSMCNMDTIGVIDHETLEVVWAWGPGDVQKQHMPTMLEDGNLLIYDNGSERGWSRIIELDPLTEEIVWSYQADPVEDFFSDIRGSNQRLPNGNTFVADSDHGRLFEVTPEGDIVWEWVTWQWLEEDEIMPIYRAMKYDPDFIEPLLGI